MKENFFPPPDIVCKILIRDYEGKLSSWSPILNKRFDPLPHQMLEGKVHMSFPPTECDLFDPFPFISL